MNKLFIYTDSKHLSELKSIIESEDRLSELIAISTNTEAEIYGYSIFIDRDQIQTFPLWDSTKLPILLPPNISFTKHNLLGVIFYLLENYDKAYQYFKENEELQLYTEICSNLLHGEVIADTSFEKLTLKGKSDQTTLHNLAIANQYGNPNIAFHDVNGSYKEALDFPLTPENSERLYYTARQYASFLADASLYHEAIHILEPYKQEQSLSPLAKTNISTLIIHLQIKLLSQPFEEKLIKQLKSNLSVCISELKERGLYIEEAFALMDASYLATIEQDYANGLTDIQRAIDLFNDADIEELAANAGLQKADLLFTWAQQGNPQYYREAMNSCLKALEVFKRDKTPDLFADIHHKLGTIYSEVLDEEKKRSLWTSFSISSFNEALTFFTKENYPYEYALICTDQGNAYTKYPHAEHSDNYAKALDWYGKALEIQNADDYPNERSITLLDYIEAAWNLKFESDFDQTLFDDMMQKAEEVKQLHVNDEFVMEADRHITHLRELASQMKTDSKE